MVKLYIKNKDVFRKIKIYFKDYSKRTGIHGFQYFGETGRSTFEKYWWCIFILISFISCSYTIYLTYEKWTNSPIIVNLANKETPIYKIPFPSVTICPEVKSSVDKFNYTKIMQKKEDGIELTPLESKYFDYMSLICDYKDHLNYSKNGTFSDEIFDVIDYLKPDFQLTNCSFSSHGAIDCGSIFIPILTEHGVCYTFNILNRSDFYRSTIQTYKNYHLVLKNETKWTIQAGYTEAPHYFSYPYRGYLSGISAGLSVNIFTAHKDLDYACKSPLQGYKILLYTPMTIPRPSLKYFRLPLDENVIAAVEPKMITTSYAVEKFPADRRGCYFQNEHYLKYFKIYTSNNCKLECLTNYTLSLCSCVNFFMPREKDTPICGVSQFGCMKLATDIMYEDLKRRLENEELSNFEDANKFCNCLPLCSDLTYDFQTSQTKFDWEKWLAVHRNLKVVPNASLSTLTVYFTADTFFAAQRNELFGPIDFLANFGGIISLFTGISLLSVIEVIYFLTVRIICNVRTYKRWVGPEV